MSNEYEMKIQSALSADQFDKVTEYLVCAYNDHFDMSKILMYTAILYEMQHMFEKAMSHYRASIAIDATNKAALYNLYRLAESRKEPIRFQ